MKKILGMTTLVIMLTMFVGIGEAFAQSTGYGGGSGRSGSSVRRTVVTPPAPAPSVNTGGQVLGASTINVSANLSVGSRGADVTALQTMLIASGDLKIGAPTGYFGPMTQAALAKWQATHGVAPASGFFGPLTQAAIAAMDTPAMSDEARAALLVDLLKQVVDLQEQLNKMIEDAA